MEDAVIVSAVRTPSAPSAAHSKEPATELGAVAVREALERARLAGDEVDEVILGCVLQAGLGLNAARQAAIDAGHAEGGAGTTINKVCGSGLKAVVLAAQMIRAGDADIVVAGGMESMTRAPYILPTARFGVRMGDAQLVDSMIADGLTDAITTSTWASPPRTSPRSTASRREEQDEFAAESQQKAERAIERGRLQGRDRRRRGARRRAGRGSWTSTSIRAPARRPRRWPSCGPRSAGRRHRHRRQRVRHQRRRRGDRRDVGSARRQERGLQAVRDGRSYASVGVEPRIMGIGPVPAVRKALERAGLELARHRPVRAQRGVRGAVARRAAGARRSTRSGSSERRGDRARPSDRRQRRADPRHAAARDAAPQRRRGVATLCVGGGQGQAAVIRNGADR